MIWLKSRFFCRRQPLHTDYDMISSHIFFRSFFGLHCRLPTFVACSLQNSFILSPNKKKTKNIMKLQIKQKKLFLGEKLQREHIIKKNNSVKFIRNYTSISIYLMIFLHSAIFFSCLITSEIYHLAGWDWIRFVFYEIEHCGQIVFFSPQNRSF